MLSFFYTWHFSTNTPNIHYRVRFSFILAWVIKSVINWVYQNSCNFCPCLKWERWKIFLQVLPSPYRSHLPKVHGYVGGSLVWSNSVLESLLYSLVCPSSPEQQFSLLSPTVLLPSDEFGRCAAVPDASSANRHRGGDSPLLDSISPFDKVLAPLLCSYSTSNMESACIEARNWKDWFELNVHFSLSPLIPELLLHTPEDVLAFGLGFWLLVFIFL